MEFARVLQLRQRTRTSFFLVFFLFFSQVDISYAFLRYISLLFVFYITNNCIAVSRVSFQVIYGVSESAVIARPDESY